MKKFIIGMLFSFNFLQLFAKDPVEIKVCKTFSECVMKSEKTDIHRKKITFYEEALKIYQPINGNLAKTKVFLLKANSIVREASGDTGYKGEIALKVTHKPEYKKLQFEKARADLKEVEVNLAKLSPTEQSLYDELIKILESE
jgi:hypothetical protein